MRVGIDAFVGACNKGGTGPPLDVRPASAPSASWMASPTEVTVFVQANQDLTLASGATTSSSSGGCSLRASEPWGWSWALTLLALPLVFLRRREAACA